MSFGGLFDGAGASPAGGGGGATRAVAGITFGGGGSSTMPPAPASSISQARLVSASLPPKSFSSSSNPPGLSLALTNMAAEGQAAEMMMMMTMMNRAGNIVNGRMSGGAAAADGEAVMNRNNVDQENDESARSDNLDGASGDDLDQQLKQDQNPARKKKKRYHRHTPQQIQELESLFKECPHPDEKQRMELSRRLSLESRQVKFWFQNRRTQMKTQIERHENTILRQENDKLHAENMSIRDAMRSPVCTSCGGPAAAAMLAGGEISLEEQHLRIENSRLKDELDRVCALARKLLGRPISGAGASTPELGVSSGGSSSFSAAAALTTDFVSAAGAGGAALAPPATTTTAIDRSLERSMYLELALDAMDELVKLAQMEEPLWIPGGGGGDTLNFEEYVNTFHRCIGGAKPPEFVSEATRESGVVIINSLALVETLMDTARWAEMFPCIVARAATTEVISSGMGGTRNGALQLVSAELQVLSPLVPIRRVSFLRFCKQHAEGVWAVIDVSVDTIAGGDAPASGGAAAYMACRRPPSGCLVQDMPNGYSKVTWVEHAEYDDAGVHHLYRQLIRSGVGLGAHRWLAALRRQCECFAILMSSSSSSSVASAAAPMITASGRRSMLKLAQRMTLNFCSGVCATTSNSSHEWTELRADGIGRDVRVMTRQSVDDPGEPPGVVLSASTSVWVPAPPRRIFDFLRDEGLRSEWDILSNGGPMTEMAHIAMGQHHGNAVSLLRAASTAASGVGGRSGGGMLILQETCTDASGSMVVYAPVDVPAMHVVMNGGDSAYVALLPSGFAILPDGGGGGGGASSLLTVAFQILVNSLPTAKLTVESVETVNNLISCTVQKIKSALCDVGH